MFIAEARIIKNRILYWIAIIILISLIGCNESLPPDKSMLGYDYFSYQLNQFRIYQTFSKKYNINGSITTEEYQIKELVTSRSFVEDDTLYRLERYRRPNKDEDWVIDSVWTARINTYTAIMVKNNVPIIKLSFPVEEDRSWDGNAMNVLDYDEFKMINVGHPYSIDEELYDKSITMVIEDVPDPAQIAELNYQVEIYSKGIGLILKESNILQHDFRNPGTILEGIEYNQKLIEIGEEL